jgi:hypothetical protein
VLTGWQLPTAVFDFTNWQELLSLHASSGLTGFSLYRRPLFTNPLNRQPGIRWTALQ